MPEVNEQNKNAMGGTELMANRIERDCNQSLLSQFQIIHSRVRDLDDSKKKILVCHDLATDPEVQHLKDGGWSKFDQIVFVSHWQREQYFMYLGVPYDVSVVMPNAIEPIEQHEKPDTKDKINLVYFATPHRGLDLLYVAFNQLAKEHKNIHLNVYSSFDLYGWGQRDESHQKLIDALKEHSNITYNRSVPNADMREILKNQHIFAYPSIWQETSCLCLIEALSAGLYCVHSSLAALPETSMGLTQMYDFSDGIQNHIDRFYLELKKAIVMHEQNYKRVSQSMESVKTIADFKYDWGQRKLQWNQLLKDVLTRSE